MTNKTDKIDLPNFVGLTRLWGPELLVCSIGAIVLAFVVSPTPTAPWTDLGGAGAWWQGLEWNIGPLAYVMGMIVIGSIFLVNYLDRVRWHNWHRARKLRYKWDNAIDGALLYRIQMFDGMAKAKCWKYKGSWDDLEKKLDRQGGNALAEIDLGGKWTAPFKVEFSERGWMNPARSKEITFYFIPLDDAWKLDPYMEPADGLKVVVGKGYEGSLVIDLEDNPHTEIIGPTGTGKGFEVRGLEIQWLLARYLLINIDGGRSAEHVPLEACPTALRAMRSGMPMKQRLTNVVNVLKAMDKIIDQREILFDVEQIDRYSDLKDELKFEHPPIGIFVDEVTALLTKEDDPRLDALRKEIKRLLDIVILRNGRKFGLFLVLSDQLIYTGVFSKGAAAQAANRVVIGNLAPEHSKQACGVVLPSVPFEKMAGHYVNLGTTDYKEIRIYPNKREHLVEAIDRVNEMLKEGNREGNKEGNDNARQKLTL